MVAGFNPFEKYWSNWKSSPHRGEKNMLKPRPRFQIKKLTLHILSTQPTRIIHFFHEWQLGSVNRKRRFAGHWTVHCSSPMGQWVKARQLAPWSSTIVDNVLSAVDKSQRRPFPLSFAGSNEATWTQQMRCIDVQQLQLLGNQKVSSRVIIFLEKKQVLEHPKTPSQLSLHGLGLWFVLAGFCRMFNRLLRIWFSTSWFLFRQLHPWSG